MNKGSERFGIQNRWHRIPTKMQKIMPPLVPVPQRVLRELNQVQMQLRAPVFKPSQPTDHNIITSEQGGNVTAEIIAHEGSLDLRKRRDLEEKKENRDKNEVKDREYVQMNFYREQRSPTYDHHISPRQPDHRSLSSWERPTNSDDKDDGVKSQPVITNNLQTQDITMSSGRIEPFSSTKQSMQTPIINQQIDKIRPAKIVPDIVPNWVLISQQMQMNNKIMWFNEGAILPWIPGAVTPQRRERPSGCRTILVTGLPAGITDDGINEIFSIFGTIDDMKLDKPGFARVRFKNPNSVERCFIFSGRRIRLRGEPESDASTIFIDYYACSKLDDQNGIENDKNTGNYQYQSGPILLKPYTASVMMTVAEQIKSDIEFCDAAPILANWLEYGKCTKKNANVFYVLIRNSNNHLKRLVMEKTQLKDEYEKLNSTFKEKFGHVIKQFEQLAKILTAANHPRVIQYFTREHREDIEMWYEMRKEMDSIRDDFNILFDNEQKNMVPLAMYEKVKAEYDKLTIEMETYKKEVYKNHSCQPQAHSATCSVHSAKTELKKQFEKLKAALSEHNVQMKKMVSNLPKLRLPAPSMPDLNPDSSNSPQPSSSCDVTSLSVNASEAKFISLLSVFLVAHPRGASLEYLVSYLQSMTYIVTPPIVLDVLLKYNDVFRCKAEAFEIPIQHKWFLKHS